MCRTQYNTISCFTENIIFIKMRPGIIVYLSFVGIISNLLGISICIMFASGQCLDDQKSLLLQLKGNVSYDTSYSMGLEYWDESEDCCKWPGVACDRPGRIIGLDLSTEYIIDGINDSSTLFDLKYLQKLNLATLGLSGTPLPSRFNQLSQLIYLNLSDSGFVGPISSEFSHLSRLVTLDLSKEPQGSLQELSIPDLELLIGNLSNLRELYLDGVDMSAQGSGWSHIIASSLPNLTVLSLSNCFLSGPFHSSLANLPSLSVVHLDNNPLSIPFPEVFTEFSNLSELTLSSCELSGTVPGKIFNLPSLRSLDLSENGELEGFFPEFQPDGSLENLFLMHTNMSGSLPDSISSLKVLTTMNLGDSHFSGLIPSSMEKLTQLVYLDLSGNQFIGSIPSFRGSKNLSVILLQNNKLSGDIPQLLWEGLNELVRLDLSNNTLSGQIPSSLFSLPSIEELELSYNNFSGKISEVPLPSLFSSKLKSLRLSGNNLEGPIPQFFFDIKNLEYLSLASNRLSGVIDFMNFLKLQNLTSLDMSYNNLSIITNLSDSSFAALPQLQHLFLASCNLRELPPLRNQSALKMLDLSNNQMTGEIPNWLWGLGDGFSFRHLNLSHNQFTVIQEPSASYLEFIDLHSNLLSGKMPLPPPTTAYLDLSNNNFSSVLPPEIGNQISRVIFFSAANNRLSGEIPLSLCNASSIQVLELSNNSLQGMIPSCLMNSSHLLGVLNLRRNNLSGNIPEMSPQNCQTETLDVSWNQIGGLVPQSLANCTNLKVLNLGYNKITDTFPCWLGNLTNLRVLSFRFNNFHGDISCFGGGYSWPNLQIIDLASNNFAGVLPSQIFKNFEAMIIGANESNTQIDHLRFETILSGDYYYQDSASLVLKGTSVVLDKILNIFTSIDFSSNKFHGGIPETIGELKLVYLVNLSNNALSSTIPSSIENLKQLESLDLSFNKLNGEVPNELASLPFISFLNVSYNQLSGRIPSGAQFQTFSSSSFEGNEGLCGFPLERSCDTPAKPEEEEQESEESEEIGIYLSVGGGFLVGLAFVFVPILTSMRWNLYYNRNIDWLICKVLPRKHQTQYQRHANGDLSLTS